MRQLPHHSQLHTQILKLDIKSYFASIHHANLLSLISLYIPEQEELMSAINKIIASHCGKRGTGLPIGNLTSQLFANLYLNELDHFPFLKPFFYSRYVDDFVVIFHGAESLRTAMMINKKSNLFFGE